MRVRVKIGRWLMPLAALLCLIGSFAGQAKEDKQEETAYEIVKQDDAKAFIDISDIPEYTGNAYVIINDNQPVFKSEELTTKAYESYGALDSLGRCTSAVASCGVELMPTGERESIDKIHPTGWVQAEYEEVSGSYLYNRCHLIGWQLSGENANPLNLITGTRYLNTEGMLLFENMVADYIKETNNHVAYRVTPIFEGDNMLASGVQIEAYSIEDGGDGICFNVFCYNVQPHIELDYSTGESRLISE